MKFQLVIESDNAVFEDEPVTETASILRDVARKIEGGILEDNCLDRNGNRVGDYYFCDQRVAGQQ